MLLSGLNTLALSSNQFSGKFPVEVLNILPNLERLALGDNAFVGCVPAEVLRACENIECRTWNLTLGQYVDGTSPADQECGMLPACSDDSETCAPH